MPVVSRPSATVSLDSSISLFREALGNGTSVVMSHCAAYLGMRNGAKHSSFAAVHVHLRKQSSAACNSSTLLIIKHLLRLSSGARGLF